MLKIFVLISLTIICLPNALGKDTIKISLGFSTHEAREKYILEILTTSLEFSKPKFGEFEIKVIDPNTPIPNQREMIFVAEGDYINIAMATTTQEWEQKTIPIYIPIRRGLLSYRLLAINKADLEKFNNITTLEQLKTLNVGVRREWAIRAVLKHLDFKIVDTYSYDAMFAMLSKGRFDYTLRGLHEINDEIQSHKHKINNIMVAPNLVLYMPSPSYFFISPKYPQIAARIKFGMELMVEQGVMADIFNKTYYHHIIEADLKHRTIIHIGNPLLSEATPFDRKELWLSFDVENK